MEHSFDLNIKHVNPGGDPGDLDIEPAGPSSFVVTVPKMKATVECCFLTGQHEKQLIAQTARKKKNKLPESEQTSKLLLMIKSVNGNEDSSYIKRFINVLPASDARYIRKAYETYAPSINLKQEYACPECGSQTVLEVPFTREFFWPE